MGKFDGVLLYTDYDETLYNKHHTVSPENHQAIRYFIKGGGRFSIATGRAHRTFTPQIEREKLEFNAPVVLSNGASVYDYDQDRFLVETLLCGDTVRRLAEIHACFPSLASESYHGEDIYAVNPNEITAAHMACMGVTNTACPVEEVPSPLVKVLFEDSYESLQQVQKFILSRWSEDYENIFSNHHLLELTCKGSTKGGMVARMAHDLGIAPDHVYCIGDNENDIPMLAVSAIPFAPANCAQVVRDWGARIVNHTDDHAVANVIEILDAIY